MRGQGQNGKLCFYLLVRKSKKAINKVKRMNKNKRKKSKTKQRSDSLIWFAIMYLDLPNRQNKWWRIPAPIESCKNPPLTKFYTHAILIITCELCTVVSNDVDKVEEYAAVEGLIMAWWLFPDASTFVEMIFPEIVLNNKNVSATLFSIPFNCLMGFCNGHTQFRT